MQWSGRWDGGPFSYPTSLTRRHSPRALGHTELYEDDTVYSPRRGDGLRASRVTRSNNGRADFTMGSRQDTTRGSTADYGAAPVRLFGGFVRQR